MLVKELIQTLSLCNPEAEVNLDVGTIMVPLLGAFVSSKPINEDDNYIDDFIWKHPDEMPKDGQKTIILTENLQDYDEDMTESKDEPEEDEDYDEDYDDEDYDDDDEDDEDDDDLYADGNEDED